jgi:hypothetical protein
MLYSFRQQRPAPLPNRIRLSNGFTRYAHQPPTAWVDFSAAIMAMPAINVMLGAVLQAAPGLYGGLVVGLQQASENDSRVFLNSWNAAYTMGLLSVDLVVTIQKIATEHDLPETFIKALKPTQ